MTVLGVIGAHNREAAQALLNPVIERGGVTEVRILKMGNDDLILSIVNELVLLHEFEKVCAVDLQELIQKDSEYVEVIEK